jgi:hypothetical protein
MLESEFPRTRADFTAGSWVRTTGGGVKTAADVSRGTRVLGVEPVARAVETAGGGG